MAQTGEIGGITRALAQFCAGLTYEDLPPVVQDRTKYLCLDFAGVALNGSTTPSARAVVRAIEQVGRTGPSVIAGTSSRALPEYAALANGTASHSIEMDDVNNESSLHPGVVAFPTALAMADIVPVDGKTFITAVTTGYEVMVRLGRALKPAEHYGRGFHPTGTCGAFGAAAVAALALGLKGDAFCWALGIAGSQAAGSMEFLGPGEAWTKRFHPGWASHSGIWAGLLARAGLLGPTSIIEGSSGFLHGYSGEPDPSQVLSDLGGEFQISRTSVKPYACCRYNQGPIDCLLDLKTRYHLEGTDVEGVKVAILSGGYNIVAVPGEEKRNPASVTDMQFSMPFGAAVALLDGQASLAEYVSEVAQRPEVKKLMAKVECVRDPALDGKYPCRWPAWAEVRTRGGLILRSETEYPKGDPENALTWDEMKAKFITLSAPVISHGRQRELIAAVEALEEMRDIRDLAALLATD